MTEFSNTYDAFWFIQDHPYWEEDGKQGVCIDVMLARINPETRRVEDGGEDNPLNTRQEVWLECGEYNKEGEACHDWELDCGGATYEEAIIKLAYLVQENYGDWDD